MICSHCARFFSCSTNGTAVLTGATESLFKRELLQFPGWRARFNVEAMPHLLRSVRIICVKLDELIVTNEGRVIRRRCQKVEVPAEYKSKLDERSHVGAFVLCEEMAGCSCQLPVVSVAFTHAVIQMKIFAGTPYSPKRHPQQALVKRFEIRGNESAQPRQP